MRNALKPIILLGLIFLTCNGLFGCSGSRSNPAVPPESSNEQYAGTDAELTTGADHSLWGIWNVEFDMDNLTATIEPVRNPQAHYNITDMVTPPACDDCVEFVVKSFDPVTRILDVDVTMRNPTKLSAHDVRGILYTNDYGHLLTNADDWTGLWDIPGGDDINPFKAFAKGEPNRLFAGEASHVENYKIYIPKPPNYGAICFAVDVSWPGNCKEPYSIHDFHQEQIDPITGASGDIIIYVDDWQDDVSEVTIEIPEITGESITYLVHDSGNAWSTELTNNQGAPEGSYDALITAKSTNSGDLALYDIVTVVVGYLPTGWACTWGGVDYDFGTGVAIDGSGNAYITGTFFDTVDFDPGPGEDEHTSSGYSDMFLSKFDSSGNIQWVRTWGGSDYDNGLGVAIDGSGNPYITGRFCGTVDFDPGPGEDEHKSSGYRDIFLSKFDSSGNFQWVLTWGGGGYDGSYGVAIDGSGSVYVTGYFQETVDFNPGPGEDEHKSNGEYDIFLSKFDSSGDFQWALTWGGGSIDSGRAVAIDGNGNAYVTGDFELTVDFDPGPGKDEHTSNGDLDIFVSKFDASGDFQWARTWAGSGAFDVDSGRGVAVDGSDNAYITGFFLGTVDFDPGPGEDEHTSNGSSDIFLSKFDSSGDFQWARTWGGSDYDYGYGIAIDGNGNAYVTGGYWGSVDFDPGPGEDEHTCNGYWDIFLSKFDSNGGFQWARTWGGYDSDRGIGIAVDGSDNAYVTGWFYGNVDFDPGPGEDKHTSNGIRDIFLSKFLPDGTW